MEQKKKCWNYLAVSFSGQEARTVKNKMLQMDFSIPRESYGLTTTHLL